MWNIGVLALKVVASVLNVGWVCLVEGPKWLFYSVFAFVGDE